MMSTPELYETPWKFLEDGYMTSNFPQHVWQVCINHNRHLATTAFET